MDVIGLRTPRNRVTSDDGATAVEYGLLIMMITLVVGGTLIALFGSIGDAFTYIIGFLS